MEFFPEYICQQIHLRFPQFDLDFVRLFIFEEHTRAYEIVEQVWREANNSAIISGLGERNALARQVLVDPPPS